MLSHLQEDIQEDFGWKLVHGDVFRPPSNIMLLSVFIGNGVQILLMTFIALGKIIWNCKVQLLVYVSLGKYTLVSHTAHCIITHTHRKKYFQKSPHKIICDYVWNFSSPVC